MTLANCKECGVLFLRARAQYCSSCQQAQDRLYMRMRDYLRTHPRSTVLEIHIHTGIPVAKLLELGKQEYVPFAR